MSQRIKWVDFAKGITILLVVIGHVSLGLLESGSFNDNNKLLSALVQAVYVFHMPVFFALSGFFFKTLNSKKDFSQMFRKKIISLGIPYVAFSLVMIFMKKMGGGNVRRPIGITAFFDIYKYPIDHLWFLYVLFGIFMYVSFLSLFIKNDRTLLMVALGGYLVATLIPINIYLLQRTLVWCPMFVLGKILKNIILKKYVAYLMVFFYTIYIILWMLFSFKIQIGYSTPGFRGIIFVVSVLLAFSVFPSLKEDNSFFKYFTKCGKISLPIYLIHVPVASVVRIILLKLGVTQVFVQLALGIVGAWFISIIIFKSIHRFKYFDFFLYPMNYIKKDKQKGSKAGAL